MLPTLLSRVQQLFEFVYSRPLPPQLVVYLGDNFCPMGETSAIAVSSLHDDGRVICDHAYGFLHNEKMVGSTSSILSDRPGSEAFIKLKNMVLTQEDVETKYADFVRQDFMQGFKSAVLMPIGTRKIYGLAMQCDAAEIRGFSEYVDCVSTLLNFYETALGSGQSSLSKFISSNKDLTSRQELILTLIKEGKTNAAIGNELGYSESLIRQETIIIYKKLGVSGRRDIHPNMQD